MKLGRRFWGSVTVIGSGLALGYLYGTKSGSKLRKKYARSSGSSENVSEKHDDSPMPRNSKK